jgi:hypothetical protein
MSALENYVKNKPLTGHLITLSIALICVFVLWGLSRGNVREEDLNIKLDKKADKVYVDSIIFNHEIEETKRYNRIDSFLVNIIDILKYENTNK